MRSRKSDRQGEVLGASEWEVLGEERGRCWEQVSWRCCLFMTCTFISVCLVCVCDIFFVNSLPENCIGREALLLLLETIKAGNTNIKELK